MDIVLPPHKFCKRRKKAQKTLTRASSWLDDPCQGLDHDFGQDPPSDYYSRKDPVLDLNFRTNPPLDLNSEKDQLLDLIRFNI